MHNFNSKFRKTQFFKKIIVVHYKLEWSIGSYWHNQLVDRILLNFTSVFDGRINSQLVWPIKLDNNQFHCFFYQLVN